MNVSTPGISYAHITLTAFNVLLLDLGQSLKRRLWPTIPHRVDGLVQDFFRFSSLCSTVSYIVSFFSRRYPRVGQSDELRADYSSDL